VTLDLKEYPVLVVDDEEDNLVAFDLNFADDFTLRTASSGAQALEILAKEPVAVLVVDQRMPGMTGTELLARAAEVAPDAIGILLTAYRDIDVIIAALHSGRVYRYLQKPWDPREVEVVLRQAIERYALQAENRRLHRRLEELTAYLGEEVDSRYNFGEMVGQSPRLKEVIETLRKVAPTRSTVLITGESGTGKELAARAIHHLSSRKDGPFVRVNLAALTPTLIESELFGHEKGAFTGALAQKLGRFELAHEGTLFLDEIGDLPLETQIKLLRVIQEREFERVGGSRTVQVDVRIVAATNQKLEELVAAGRFREDLYYRIRVFPIHVPPLRERREDIPLLANHFLEKFGPVVGRFLDGIEPEALARLTAYRWPGNVRELENAIERALILAEGDRLAARDFSFLETEGQAPALPPNASLDDVLGSMERQQLTDALARHDGSVSAVARELGINRTTLYYRLKKYGLMP
jgi:DNA-binding NtrC family response regulator